MTGMHMMFLSGGGGVVTPLPGMTNNVDTINPTPAASSITFNTSGTTVGSTGVTNDWFRPTGGSPGANYFIKAVLAGGTTPTGGPAMGAWNSLSTSVGWSNSRGSLGSTNSVLTVSISRTASDADIVSSGTYTITATVSN